MENELPTSDKVIFVKDIKKSYELEDTSYPILTGVDFEIKKGEMVALMGPSGSGKTTLLNILGVLDTADSGSYYLDGELITKNSNLAKIRNQKIGFVFQTFNLIPRISIVENVEIPMIYSGIRLKERKQKAKELLTKVGLSHRFENKPNQLSGGERQRTAIARALANNPSIILADEPTGNLDSKTGAKIMDLIKDLNHNDGVTIIIVTHDDNVAKKCDRVIRILDGKVN